MIEIMKKTSYILLGAVSGVVVLLLSSNFRENLENLFGVKKSDTQPKTEQVILTPVNTAPPDLMKNHNSQ